MIQGFSYNFAASSDVDTRFGRLAVNFNEEISDWNVSGATNMEGSFVLSSEMRGMKRH
jgi:hypothetical protein